ncbi:MAG: hypothetical protein WC294_08055 [Methanoregula sp.]|jgi:hypothetical protein
MNWKEIKHLIFSIIAARKVQTFLWGEANGAWGIEEWRRMFRKRMKKIEEIEPDNPHALVEFRKRLLQNAALSIALLAVLDRLNEIPWEDKSGLPSNLPEYAVKDRP